MSAGMPRTPAAVGRRNVLATAVGGIAATTLGACGFRRGEPRRETPPPADSPPPTGGGATGRGTVGLGIVGILTADIDRSLRFYRRLGLEVPESAGGHSHRLRSADGHVLFWEDATEIHTFDPAWALPPRSPRRIVLEFGFASPEDLDDTYRSLVAAGAPSYRVPFDQGGGVRYAIVEDPDGNQVSLRYPSG